MGNVAESKVFILDRAGKICMPQDGPTELPAELQMVEEVPFLEWLSEECKQFGCRLVIVSDESDQCEQFVKGFGGIGAVLRYPVKLENKCEDDDDDNDW